jgi:hypothetical protein
MGDDARFATADAADNGGAAAGFDGTPECAFGRGEILEAEIAIPYLDNAATAMGAVLALVRLSKGTW